MFAGKALIFLCLTLVMMAVTMAAKPAVIGGSRPVTDLKLVEKELNMSLTKLAAGDGPNYKLGKVYSASRQVVSGSLTKIVADLVDVKGKTKKCAVSIWSRPWLPNGVEVTFDCDGEPRLVKKHSA